MHELEWSRSATNGLAAICLVHPTVWAEIDAAEQQISDKLQRDPLHFSQPVAEGLRKIISQPIAAYVSIEGNRVTVDAVGWIG